MLIRGINYDVGVEFWPGELSRPECNEAELLRDFQVIRDELCCNSVNLYGSGLQRLEFSARIALELGLPVCIQPRLIDRDRKESLAFLETAAGMAERLRSRGPVTFNTGCEVSLFCRGFLPGSTFLSRIRNLKWSWVLLPVAQLRLRSYLRSAVRRVRTRFGGPITYSAGVWENVDWSLFDLAGVNLYRDRSNARNYAGEVRKLQAHGKPLVITEFGCATYEGAEHRGGDAWLVVDFDRSPRALKTAVQRSEKVQAAAIAEHLDGFAAAEVHGSYLFDFLAAGFPYNPDPAKDLDAASYGIVKVLPGDSRQGIRWEPKQAFHTVAERYRTLAAIEK